MSTDEHAVTSLLMLCQPDLPEGSNSSLIELNENPRDAVISSSSLLNDSKLIEPNNLSSNIKISKKRKSLTHSVDELRKYFHLPIQTVSKELGICTTILKKICRSNNIQKWPYRQIKSLTCAIQSLEVAMLNDSVAVHDRVAMNAQIQNLQSSIDAIFADPSILNNSKDDDDDDRNTQLNENTSKTIKIGTTYISKIPVLNLSNPNVSISNHTSGNIRNINSTEVNFVGSDGNGSHAAPTVMDNFFEDSDDDDDDNSGEFNDQNIIDDHYLINRLLKRNKSNIVPPDNSLGRVQVREMTWKSQGRRKTQFVPPVIFPELVRRNFQFMSNRTLVPLLEPEICANFDISLLPRSILEKKSRI